VFKRKLNCIEDIDWKDSKVFHKKKLFNKYQFTRASYKNE